MIYRITSLTLSVSQHIYEVGKMWLYVNMVIEIGNTDWFTAEIYSVGQKKNSF